MQCSRNSCERSGLGTLETQVSKVSQAERQGLKQRRGKQSNMQSYPEQPASSAYGRPRCRKKGTVLETALSSSRGWTCASTP